MLFRFFLFVRGDKCDLRETRHSVRKKNVFEHFERMRLEIKKRGKQKQQRGNKTNRAAGRRLGTKRETGGEEKK